MKTNRRLRIKFDIDRAYNASHLPKRKRTTSGIVSTEKRIFHSIWKHITHTKNRMVAASARHTHTFTSQPIQITYEQSFSIVCDYDNTRRFSQKYFST